MSEHGKAEYAPAQQTPAQQTPAQQTPAQRGSASQGTAGRAQARILIVEDQAWDAELAERLLSRAGLGFTAVVVDSLGAFTEQVAAFRPDVIVSDYHLQGFTGADVLALARQHCPEVPFIVWSGVLGDEAAVDLIKQGATDYILKDRPARLPSAVQRALDEARYRARLAEIEDQLAHAQRLAGLGRLLAAGHQVSRTKAMLDAMRREAAGPATRT